MSKDIKKKYENVRKALIKSEFEKNFWQRKVKYYAPNNIQVHYDELDNLWADFCVKVMGGEQNAENIPK